MTYPFQASGYEDMESSTQLIMLEAQKRGVNVEVLDRKTNLIRLTKDKKVEYLKDATRSSKSSMISHFLMSDKEVTKQLLHEKGFNIPRGTAYSEASTAYNDYTAFKTKKIVIKPNTTNFGDGIHILDSPTLSEYKAALDYAFTFDTQVLIEPFIPGKEYRFLVIGSKTIAVLYRDPANIVGNGKNTIRELIDEKNSDIKRSVTLVTPIITLKIADVEKAMLKKQHLTLESIPPKHTKIYLRENSNLSKGGDSIDCTDDMHSSYKILATQAAVAMNDPVCGVDMIVPDMHKPATKDSTDYTILELNYNPAICIHDYPYQGKNRHTAGAMLDLLGF